ncbi:uncharacterized protein BDR25DRAFT_152192, partial [Lindgomyces ingoldianus]
TIISTILFAFALWYVQAAFSAETAIWTRQALNRVFKIDVGSTLAVLRITQGILSTCTTIGLMRALEMLQWGLAGRHHGLEGSTFLGLSPTTHLLGVFRISISRISKWPARAWGLGRIILVTAIWVAGVVLFIKATVVTAYDPVFTYKVTAGVGQFNGSYVSRYLDMLKNVTAEYPYQIVPYSVLQGVSSLVGNSMHVINAPKIDCPECDSYLLTGGVIMTTPWYPTGYSSYPLVNIDKVPASQIQFRRGMNSTDSFQDEDCDIYGSKSFLIGIKVCVSKSKSYPGSIVAGVFVCANGTDNGECERHVDRPNITTTMSVYQRTAGVVASRANFSIMSITDIGPAEQNLGIDIPTFRKSLAWFLDFNASATPPPSSIAEKFWNSQEQISNPYWSGELTRLLQSMLAYPLYFFQPNNYGNLDLKMTDMIDDLPAEFYTKAQITRPYARMLIHRGMFIAFIALQSVALIFIWVVLIWVWVTKPSLPQLSSYPLVDFAFKSK